jgi:ubiquinone/menaquinone biosynthesis C-methylase UbiE
MGELLMSWNEAFANGYDEWSAHMTEDIAFYVELAREADGPLVELAIGSGRVAIPVAHATGRPVIGIDSSPAMLEQARVRAVATGVELIDVAGLELEALYGGFDREPLGDESREYVFVVRR